MRGVVENIIWQIAVPYQSMVRYEKGNAVVGSVSATTAL